MTDSYQPPEEIFDEVEGHMPRARILDKEESDDLAEADDVEGHGKRPPGVDESDDVEGHGKRLPPVEAEETDDAEGHAFRHLADDESDDVEGHLGGKTVPAAPEDNEKSWQR